MWITILRTMILFIGVLYGVSTGADVLLEQRHDTNNQVLSFWHPVAGFQAGDDYIPSRRTRITSVTFWMIATWPEVPYNWSFAVHRSTTDHSFFDFAPEYPWFHFQTGPTSVIDLGDWAGRAGTHLFEVRFDNVDLILDPADS
ncbi:MAG: hypothetical protein KJZ68_09945, partial [Phycisphaerales bacterium]|nr:hypothetical protein [Phycisphaerales bacterium]